MIFYLCSFTPRTMLAQFVTTDEELVQIAQLSQDNLVSNISAETKNKEGFVTWAYPLDTLRAIHRVSPSVIVKDSETVAGYALVLTQNMAPLYPPLQTMLDYFKKVQYQNRPVFDFRFYVMGQVCVHPQYRGKGVFNKLYQYHKQQFASQYDFVLTEISTSNLRSQRAHSKTGFKTIHTYHDAMDEWDVVLWDFS